MSRSVQKGRFMKIEQRMCAVKSDSLYGSLIKSELSLYSELYQPNRIQRNGEPYHLA